MLYREYKRNTVKKDFKAIISHPYFGFLALGLFMLIMQLLYFADIVPISVMRALGHTMIYIIVGLGFSILLGYGGLASLGTAGFVGLGAYFLGYLHGVLGFPFIITLAISLVFGIIIGGIVGFISLRIEGMYLAIITLGLSEILNEVFKNATEITRGTNGLNLNFFKIFGFSFNREMVFLLIIIILILMMVLTLNIIKSPMGRAMSAMKNSESAAQAMGVSILKYRLLAFVLSTLYAIIGGILYMAYWTFSIPTTWTLALSLNILAAIIVGGPRSILGVTLGTFMIFGLDLAVFQRINFFIQNPDITLIFNGVLIIVVVMFYPGGLSRLITTIRFKISTQFKKRKLQLKEYYYGKDD